MIYYLYTNYNRVVEAFERPIVMQEDCDEYIERISRDFKASDDNAKAKMAEYDIFYRGTYDDNTGEFKLIEPNRIFSVASLIVKKEEQNNA